MQDNPFGKMLEEMFGGGARGQARQEAREEAQQPTQQNPLNDMFDEMFNTGRKNQETYQRGVESIFDQFKRGMDRNG